MISSAHLGSSPGSRHRERGGITILVVLSLLVLLTVAALSMSRDAFREVVMSGTARQGAMAQNLADSGIEFSILWIRPANQIQAASSSSAEKLQGLASTLVQGQQFGRAYRLDGSLYTGLNTAVPPSDLQVPSGSGNGFNLALTAMGKMPMTNQSQTAGTLNSGYTPAAGSVAVTAPDLWAVRSDGVVNVAGVMFTHSKEAWISTPPR